MTYFLRYLRLPASLLLLCLTSWAAHAQQAPHFNWVKALEGYHSSLWPAFNWGSSITTHANGDVFITGSFIRSLDFNPEKEVDSQSCYPHWGCYFAKYDSMGLHNWAKVISSAKGNAIFVDDSGYVYIGGAYFDSVDFDPGPARKTLPASTIISNFFVAKYTPSGALKWVRGAGGANYADEVQGVTVDNQGNVYVTGSIHGTVDFNELNPGSTVYTTNVVDGFVAKYDRNGNYLWSNQINGNDGDQGMDIQLDQAGNVYVCGYTGGAKFSASTAIVPTAGLEDAFIAKYTSGGSLVWAKTIGGGATDLAGKLAIDKAGNVLLSGSHEGNIVFNPGSPTGTLVNNWSTPNAFVAKFNSSGGYLWSKGYGGRGINHANAIAVDDSSNVYIGGYFSDTMNISTGVRYIAHPHALDLYGAVDMFLLKLQPDGTYVWSKAFGANGGDQIKDIWLDKKYNVHFTGFIARTSSFDASAGGLAIVNNPNPNDVQNTVFCKFSQVKPAASGVRNVSSGNLNLQAYPNPVNDQLTITGIHPTHKTYPVVTDIAGKQFTVSYTQQIGQMTLQTHNLAPGLYFVRCTDDNGFSGTVKMVKVQ